MMSKMTMMIKMKMTLKIENTQEANMDMEMLCKWQCKVHTRIHDFIVILLLERMMTITVMITLLMMKMVGTCRCTRWPHTATLGVANGCFVNDNFCHLARQLQ